MTDYQHAREILDELGVPAPEPARVWEPTPWARRGRCHGKDITHLFFGPPYERPDAREDRETFVVAEYCAPCPVRPECRDYGRRHNEHGIWGGENDTARALATGRIPLPSSSTRDVIRAARYGRR